jgi:hypothetical protein
MQLTCKHCEHRWESRKSNPRSCPACKRYIYETLTTIRLPYEYSMRIRTLSHQEKLNFTAMALLLLKEAILARKNRDKASQELIESES